MLGAECCWTSARSITWTRDGARARVARLHCVRGDRRMESFSLADGGMTAIEVFGMVLYRTDPPVDLAYLHPLQLMANAGPELVNPLPVLCQCSEKLTFCPELMPESIASSDWDELLRFGKAEGRTVVKPLHRCQSQGVELIEWDTGANRERAHRVLSGLTESFRRPVLLQRYLPAVLEGETRLWFVDGTLLGAVRKLPAKGTFCIDMDKGGTLARHQLTTSERRAVSRLSACLLQHGIRLAAVDLIDGLVTDFNFTSPGLLTGMEEVLGRNLARPVMESLLRVNASTSTSASTYAWSDQSP